MQSTIDSWNWLDAKVMYVFERHGSLRMGEFAQLKVEDVQKHGEAFLVNYRTKSNLQRSFMIRGGYARIVQRFIDMKSPNVTPNELFLSNYRQLIGTKKLSNLPRRMTEYWKRAEPEPITAQSFRRILAHITANSETMVHNVERRNEAVISGMVHPPILGTSDPTNAGRSVIGASAGMSVIGTIVSTSVPSTSSSILMNGDELAETGDQPSQ